MHTAFTLASPGHVPHVVHTQALHLSTGQDPKLSEVGHIMYSIGSGPVGWVLPS